MSKAAPALAQKPRPQIRFRGRSFMALVLAPFAPLEEWMDEFDILDKRSPGFFTGRPVILELSALQLDAGELEKLVAELRKREIRLVSIEGTAPGLLRGELAALASSFSGGRDAAVAPVYAKDPGRKRTDTDPAQASGEAPGAAPDAASDASPDAAPDAAIAEAAAAVAEAAARPQTHSLLIDRPVRSGQAVLFPQGDVTIIGQVASGAEVIAGGSIHVYGPLRGRAIAGSTGNAQARIFCHKLLAELVAIDGLYKTAEDLRPELRGKPVQIRLDGDALKMTVLGEPGEQGVGGWRKS